MSRRVLITGASRGIGRAIALRLARDGFAVALNFRSGQTAAEELFEEIRSFDGEASLLGFDVSEREAAGAAISADIEDKGPFWGLVLNAGITADGPLASLGAEDWDRVLRTNLDGFHHVVQPLLMPMVRLRDGGRIVTLSSVAGIAGNRGQTNYAASKAGLIGATRSLALELAKRGIAVNSVAPGFIATDMLKGVPDEEIAERVPMKRAGRPEEVAALVSFLFGEEAAYITGQVLSVNGGMV